MDSYEDDQSTSRDRGGCHSLCGAAQRAVRKRDFPYVFRMDEEVDEMLLEAGIPHRDVHIGDTEQRNWSIGHGYESEGEMSVISVDEQEEAGGEVHTEIRGNPLVDSLSPESANSSSHLTSHGIKRKHTSGVKVHNSTAKTGDEYLIQYVLKRIAEKTPINWHYLAGRVGMSVQDTFNRWDDMKDEFAPFIGDVQISSLQTRQNENNFICNYTKNRFSKGGAVRLGYIAAKLNCSLEVARERFTSLFPRESNGPGRCLVVDHWFTAEEEAPYSVMEQRRTANKPFNHKHMATLLGCDSAEMKLWYERHQSDGTANTMCAPAPPRRKRTEMLAARTTESGTSDPMAVCVVFARALFTHRSDRKYHCIRNAAQQDINTWHTELTGRPVSVYRYLRAAHRAALSYAINTECMVTLQFIVTAVELTVVVDDILSDTNRTSETSIVQPATLPLHPTLTKEELFNRTNLYMKYIKRSRSHVDWEYLSERLSLPIKQMKLYWYHLLRDMVVHAIATAVKKKSKDSMPTKSVQTTLDVVDTNLGSNSTSTEYASPVQLPTVTRTIVDVDPSVHTNNIDAVIRAYMSNVDSTRKPNWAYLAQTVGMTANEVKQRWWGMHNDTIHSSGNHNAGNSVQNATLPQPRVIKRRVAAPSAGDMNMDEIVTTPAIEALRNGKTLNPTSHNIDTIHSSVNHNAGKIVHCPTLPQPRVVKRRVAVPAPGDLNMDEVVTTPAIEALRNGKTLKPTHRNIDEEVIYLPPPHKECVVIDLTSDDL